MLSCFVAKIYVLSFCVCSAIGKAAVCCPLLRFHGVYTFQIESDTFLFYIGEQTHAFDVFSFLFSSRSILCVCVRLLCEFLYVLRLQRFTYSCVDVPH